MKQHLKRANYQAHIWSRALHPQTDVGPEHQGWQLKDGRLEIVWTDLAPAPEAVMELVCCGCKGARQTRRCSCVRNGLPCTDACTCTDQCVNSVTDPGDDDDRKMMIRMWKTCKCVSERTCVKQCILLFVYCSASVGIVTR